MTNDIAREMLEIQQIEMHRNFDYWARSQGLLVKKVAIVATGGLDDTNVTVYFPPDLTTASGGLKNKTGRTLVANEKVYVLSEYGETDQGWIFD